MGASDDLAGRGTQAYEERMRDRNRMPHPNATWNEADMRWVLPYEQPATVASASDDRTANNSVRHNYRVLSDAEKAGMVAIKDAGAALIDAIREHAPAGREASLGVTNAEQAVMWAVKGLTG